MRLDPRLLERLEQREDANDLLAAALGLCPTCRQPMPPPEPATVARGPRGGEKREAIFAWRRANPKGTQSECSRALQVSMAYVNRLWHRLDAEETSDEDEDGGRDE